MNSEQILKQYWGYNSFRPLQKEIIESVLAKKDTLALLPTGGGKSVCYQVPALAQEGICLVISPLIALMKDQVENLKKRGIHALSIYSGMHRTEIIKTLKNAAYGNFKLLYVSPERIETSLFKEYLPALHINLIAVDEAHCISQWGYDFRPSYLRITELRNELINVPVLALTASATREVQEDICEKLSSRLAPLPKGEHFTKSQELFARWSIFRQSYKRGNLSYSSFKVDSKMSKLADVISKVQGSTIVYTKSRKRTTEISNLLQMHGITTHHYHAGLLPEERNKRQEDWVQNKVKAIVCTNAFGMGIDKPDVRLVIHADMPDSLENYYQEAGRAGRDSKRSYAVLLYDERDVVELNSLHTKRFPTFEQIKEVYNALANYLQISVNTSQDVSYTFHFETFIKNFKLDSNIALYSLKAIEQDGWIDFNEKSFTPSTVIFTASKEQLYDFQKNRPEYEHLLTTLLRTYEGIFDFPAFISEKLLSRLLKTDEAIVKQQLKKAASFGNIKYKPQNDEPQIIFRKNRVAANDLTINFSQYNRRKDAFIKRSAKIIEYANTNTCRSWFINLYFGDDETKPCGICDNCLRLKSLNVTPEEFEKIRTSITNCLSGVPITFSQLIDKLKGIPKGKARRVIEFLQAENQISVDKNGTLKNTY
ncbi:MAG: ATP-dependent DNA helicase RecQ [Chitinophagaceae bacterium]